MAIGDVAATGVAGDEASIPSTLRVGDIDLPVWPEGQAIDPMSAPLMAITTFKDWEVYHPSLIDAALRAENDPDLRVTLAQGLCGIKVRKVPQWPTPSARLIHGRA